jgi:hypothetical protein
MALVYERVVATLVLHLSTALVDHAHHAQCDCEGQAHYTSQASWRKSGS